MLVRVNYLANYTYTVTLDAIAEDRIRQISVKSKVFFSSGAVRMCVLRGIEILSEECGLTESESEVKSGVGEKTSTKETH